MRWKLGWLIGILWFGLAFAQDFSGTFATQGQNGSIVLTVQQSGDQVKGSLSGNGAQFTLEGQIEGDEAAGVLRDNQGAMYFLMYFEDNQLHMTLAEIDPNSREPVPGSEREVVFQRSQGNLANNPGTPNQPTQKPPQNPPASNPSSASDFVGKYSGQDIALEITRTSNGYVGSIKIQGKSYPVSASVAGGKLNGSFKMGNSTYLFAASLNANKLSLQLGGKIYTLAKGGTLGSTNPQPANQNPAPNNAQPSGNSSYQVEIQAGAQYAANSRIGSKVHGIALTVPAGFKGQTTGALTALGDGQGNGILVIPLLGAEMNEVVSLLASPIQLTDQITLNPEGQPIVQGSKATVRYSGEANGIQVIAIGMASLSQGRGVVFQAITDGAQAAKLERTAQALFASVGFLTPQGSAQLKQATALFTGKQIGTFTYNKTSGASSQSTLDLCSNGAYGYQGDSERPWQAAYRTSGGSFTFDSTGGDIMGMVPGSQTSSQHQGQWHMALLGSQLLLVLKSQTGEVYVRQLSSLNQRFPFMDGKEVGSFGASQRCR